MKATLSVTTGGDNLNAATICDIMSHPLHTMWKSVDVSANEVSLTNSHTENLFVADVLGRLYQHKDKNDDLAGCSIGLRNSPGQYDYLTKLVSNATVTSMKTNNKPAHERIKSIKEDRYVIDDLRFCFFGVGPQFLPVNNKLTLKFTKDTNRRTFTGSELQLVGNLNGTDSDFHVANAHDNTYANFATYITNGGQNGMNLGHLDDLKTELNDFKIHFKVLTPDAQIQEDINRMLDVEGKYINLFYQEIHVRSEVHKLSNSKFTCNNVFGFNCPYVLIIGLVRSDFVNGDFYRTPAYCMWEKMKDVVVKVNSVPIGAKIENSKDAYFHTRQALHLGDSEKMYTDYANYEKGDALIVFELNPTEDSNLKLIPKEMKKKISIWKYYLTQQTTLKFT